MTVVLAAGAAIGTVYLLLTDRGETGLRRVTGAPPPRSAMRQPAALGLLAAAGLVAVAIPSARPAPHHVLVVATAVGVAAASGVLVRRIRRRARRAATRRQAVDVCDALVAELRAGQPPARALDWAARTWPLLEPASTLAQLGGDVPSALRRAATQTGAESLGQLAAGWQVAQRSGAGLAEVLDRLSRSLRDDEDVRREVAASLGPTRATGRLLAVLPVFGLGLGYSMGADPLAVLLGSTFGAGAFAAGAALAVSGLFWVERIADRAESC